MAAIGLAQHGFGRVAVQSIAISVGGVERVQSRGRPAWSAPKSDSAAEHIDVPHVAPNRPKSVERRPLACIGAQWHQRPVLANIGPALVKGAPGCDQRNRTSSSAGHLRMTLRSGRTSPRSPGAHVADQQEAAQRHLVVSHGATADGLGQGRRGRTRWMRHRARARPRALGHGPCAREGGPSRRTIRSRFAYFCTCVPSLRDAVACAYVSSLPSSQAIERSPILTLATRCC